MGRVRVEGEKGREREGQRHKERQADGDSDTEIERQTDRQENGRGETETRRKTGRQTDRHTDRHKLGNMQGALLMVELLFTKYAVHEPSQLYLNPYLQSTMITHFSRISDIENVPHYNQFHYLFAFFISFFPSFFLPLFLSFFSTNG